MLQFRPPLAESGPVLDLLEIGQLIDDAMRPGQFFVAADLRLTWIAARAETIPWEIFRGRLLDRTQTRAQKSFLSWHVIQEDDAQPATEPMLSVKLDVHERRLHVTRGLLSYVWEAFDAGGGIDSREAMRWTRELVGAIALEQFADPASLRDELIGLIWQAVVGSSRLPLTSVEAPLPAYVFGQFHYLYHADAGESSRTCWQELMSYLFAPGLGWRAIKLIEFVLRHISPADLPRFLELLLTANPHGWAVGVLTQWWREIFNDISLSPYTRVVENALTAIDLLAERAAISVGQRIHFLGHLLRKLGRHLTAYDLVTFHHRGANYPDALLLDTVLKRYLLAIERFPDRFLGDEPKARLRRRALRQGCLMRRHYEGHLVPDVPTSPGENARVMPASHRRVPEEQLLQAQRRRRQLFADDPLTNLLTDLARLILAKSVADLENIEERAELGLAVFIDRPLGYAKAPAEPDQTPLLAHEALSPSIARRRWLELLRLCDEAGVSIERESLQPLFDHGPWPTGLPHAQVAECPRPTAALCDVRKVADDFLILRTKPVGLLSILARFDLIQTLRKRHQVFHANAADFPRLCVQGYDDARQPVLALYDEQLRRRVEMRVDDSQGYVTRAGVEMPKAGLRVLTVWEDTDDSKVLVKASVEA